MRDSQKGISSALNRDLASVGRFIKKTAAPFTTKTVEPGKISKKKRPKVFVILAALVTVSVILLAGVLFLILPTSILGEASDLTHEQRDETVKEASTLESLDYATTTEGLVKAIETYRGFWSRLDLKKDQDLENYPSGATPSGKPLAGITQDEFKLICAIIGFESGDTYEGALAVSTCVANRIAEGRWTGNWERSKKLSDPAAGPSDPLSVLTADGQFAAYIDYYYLQYLESPPENVQRAVIDCFVNGKRNHNYTCFRSYETTGSVNIEGNWYFENFTGDSSGVLYSLLPDQNTTPAENPESTQESKIKDKDNASAFTNEDPAGELEWDLLYLLCAYDASKNNLEGVPKDSSGNPVSRYWDLIHGIGEYILKSVFGVKVQVSEEEIEEAHYPLYEEVQLNVYRDGTIEKETFYKRAGEGSTKIKIVVDEYISAGSLTLLDNYTGKTGSENVKAQASGDSVKVTDLLTGEETVTPSKVTGEYFIKTGKEITVEPKTKTVTKETTVRGLQKSVLLSVLGLKPGDPYKVLEKGVGGVVTNSDYIEYSRTALIEVLGLSPDDFSSTTSGADSPGSSLPTTAGGSALGWVWPLDSNGYGAFTITSLMGTRESPGGIGSTDHGGTDIGAASGVAILAVEDGEVEVAGEYGGYGNAVRLNHGRLTDGAEYKTLYGHMSRIGCTSGERVKKGDIIGYVGSTGWSTGPHLHFEVIKNGEKINGLSMYDNSILDRLSYNL